jgi:Protein of unknown function (DUF3343).
MTILLFPNVRMVIKAEKFLHQLGKAGMVRPVPTSISSECGMCIEIDDIDSELTAELLQNAGFNVTLTKNIKN